MMRRMMEVSGQKLPGEMGEMLNRLEKGEDLTSSSPNTGMFWRRWTGWRDWRATRRTISAPGSANVFRQGAIRSFTNFQNLNGRRPRLFVDVYDYVYEMFDSKRRKPKRNRNRAN